MKTRMLSTISRLSWLALSVAVLGRMALGTEPIANNDSWQPEIVRLVLAFAAVKDDETLWKGKDELIRQFRIVVEDEPIKHAEKLHYYYVWLLGKSGNKEKATHWAQTKCLKTPYNRVEAMVWNTAGDNYAAQAALGSEIAQEFPLYVFPRSLIPIHGWQDLNSRLGNDARLRWCEANQKQMHELTMQFVRWRHFADGFAIAHKKYNADPIILIGDLYASMNDLKMAAHALQSADIRARIDSSITIRGTNPHLAWEKLALLYEKHGDWDMALHWRLKQLAGTTRELGGVEKIKPLTDKVIYLLARIGAGEPLKSPPVVKYDLTKLRKIAEIYCDLRFPNEAMKVVELMEKVAGKELPEDRAFVLESKAKFLAYATEKPHSVDFWVLLWDEVWTYDKVVAVHRQAIEWGKKAGWQEARIKKLELQIEKLPDVLKYVKEPKNLKEMLSGKAKEPVWE